MRLFLCACIFFVSVSLAWILLDHSPPNWDDAFYLTNSLVMFDSLVDHGVAGYAARFLTILRFKAPLITVLPTPFYLIFGRRWHAALLVNLVSMIVLLAAVYWIGKRLGNARAGAVAVCVTGTMPLLYGLAHWFLVEYALTAAVALTIALLMASEDLENSPLVFLCGVVCGLGLLLKVSFPVFVLPVFLYLLVRSRRRARALLVLLLPCFALTLPWYAVNYQRTILNAIDAGFGRSALVQGTGAIFSLHAIGTYLLNIARGGTTIYYVTVCGVLILWKRRTPVVLLLWLAPLLLFVFGGNKDIRYIAPILPAFALVLALATDRVPAALLALMLAYPLVSMWAVLFGVPYRTPAVGYAHSYSQRSWLQDEILTAICQNAPIRPGERRSLLVGSDRGWFNSDNFALVVVERRLPFDVGTLAYETAPQGALHAVEAADFLIFKEGGEPESPFFSRFSAQMLDHVRSAERFHGIPFEQRLPDGGIARIFKNTVQWK